MLFEHLSSSGPSASSDSASGAVVSLRNRRDTVKGNMSWRDSLLLLAREPGEPAWLRKRTRMADTSDLKAHEEYEGLTIPMTVTGQPFVFQDCKDLMRVEGRRQGM